MTPYYAIAKLRTAKGRLSDLQAPQGAAQYVEAFEAALVALRSAFDVAERDSVAHQRRVRGRKAGVACRAWFDEAAQAAREDDLVAWAWDERSLGVHEGRSRLGGRNVGASFTDSDLQRPPGFEDAAVVVNARGTWLVAHLGTAKEEWIKAPMASRPGVSGGSVSVILKDPPAMHRGAPLEALTPTRLVELAVRWTEEFLEDVIARWWNEEKKPPPPRG